jgi:hypothetical protein
VSEAGPEMRGEGAGPSGGVEEGEVPLGDVHGGWSGVDSGGTIGNDTALS